VREIVAGSQSRDVEVGEEVGVGVGGEGEGFFGVGDLEVSGGVVDVGAVQDAVGGIFEGELEEDGASLGDVDKEGFFIGIEFPGDGEVGMAGGVEPLVEEGMEVAAADGLHDLFEIRAGSIFVAISVVVGGDAFPEKGVTEFAAEHMEDPAAFLIAVGVEELHVICLYGSVDNGCQPFFFKSDNGVPVLLKAFLQGVGAILILQVTEGHIGGKAFAKPEVPPFRLGGGIAKPLMGDLMGHQGFYAAGADGTLVVEDGACVLEAAEAGL
jgi:hypothetical protein